MDFPRRQFPAISHFILRQGQRYRHDRGLLRKYIKTQYDLTSKTSEKEKGEDGSNATSMMDLMRKKDANGQRVLSPIEVEDEALTSEELCFPLTCQLTIFVSAVRWH